MTRLFILIITPADSVALWTGVQTAIFGVSEFFVILRLIGDQNDIKLEHVQITFLSELKLNFYLIDGV